jgi:DNA-binding MarR family transcriptional regulator
MISQAQMNHLQQARAKGIGRLLLLTRRGFLSRLKKEMAQEGGVPFSRASGALLPFIDLDGTRSSEIARRSGITKQAVAKGVKELEDAGLLSRKVDSADARAALICFTEQGIAYLQRMHRAISCVESQYESQLGKDTIDGLRKALQTLIAFDSQKE